MQQTKTWNCTYCTKPVSEVGGFTKISMNKVAHNNCHAEAEAEAKLAEQERVLTDSFQRKEIELKRACDDLTAQLNAARASKGESAVVVRENSVTYDTKAWDEAAEDICALACAHIGPALPLATLKRYAWFIYTKLRDKKLIQPLKDDEERPLTEKQVKERDELEAWLKKTTKEGET